MEAIHHEEYRKLRPLPASRGGGVPSHHRIPSNELHNSRSEQNLRQGWRPSSTTHAPDATARCSSSLQTFSLSPPTFLNPAYTPTVGHSISATPLVISQSPHTSYQRQSFQPSTSSRPRSVIVQGLVNDQVLVAPPYVGDTVRGRPSSPVSSAAGSLGRGGHGSSPIRGSDRSRPVTPTESKLVKKIGWMSTKSHSRSESTSSGAHDPHAWVVTPDGRRPYDISCLMKGQPVSELWDTDGNTFVYLFAPELRLGPSFKINSVVLSSSKFLSSLLRNAPFPNRDRAASGQDIQRQEQSLHNHIRHVSLDTQPIAFRSRPPAPLERQRSRSTNASYHTRFDKPGTTDHVVDDSAEELHLYISHPLELDGRGSELSLEDIDKLVAIRNLFSFLIKGFLLGTSKQPSFFSIFLNIAEQLRHYEFTNLDGSTFGEAPSANFVCYVKDLMLDDVRLSREKTIEALVLGERMKSWDLYNEGFAHGVGKWDSLVQVEHLFFSTISNITQTRMEKASRDLSTRVTSVCARLDDFEFPSLFAGVASSAAQSKVVDFKAWRASFGAMRKHTMALYKSLYGSWPPNAKSKKNDFEESGLNRLLLQEVYRDLSDVYDMLVDRTSFTTRTMEMSHNEVLSPDPQMNALRTLMGEYDRSSPPVQPPVPFDLPLIPDLSSTRRDFNGLPSKKQAKERNKNLKDDEINMALMQSYNRESVKVTPFIEAFVAFERSSAHGRSIQEMVELRIGQWIFLYVVLQSLPLLVVDAPGLKWTQGVEYFLCEVPKGSPPWVREDAGRKLGYYRSAGGSIVSLPLDIVDHGVEGIYRRSHCWQAAESWTSEEETSATTSVPASSHVTLTIREPVSHESLDGASRTLSHPQLMKPDSMPGSRTGSPERPSSRNSMAFGLEALPVPPGMMLSSFESASRTTSIHDPTKSFDDIIGTTNRSPRKKK